MRLGGDGFRLAQTDRPAIFPDEDPLSPADYRLVWPTLPGQRYEVRQSSDLQTWAVVPAFPAVATGSILELPFLAGDALRFFQVLTLEGNPPVPHGMALIPAGLFQMGDTFGEGGPDQRPVHPVFVSAFHMDKFEVTNALWDEVKDWGVGQGYGFDSPGAGKAADHPVHSINWYDMVKWCNARSQKEGLTPCYYTDTAQTLIYKTGNENLANNRVKWTANGYRLPTEAEWEKAARGGASGHRFPWSDTDTITHSQANYWSRTIYAYDISRTRGPHRIYEIEPKPYTSPAGAFAANGYGLFDMAGNVYEWTWDAYSDTWYGQAGATADDSRGPAFGSNRVLRGGYWVSYANILRCAYRFFSSPAIAGSFIGFRCVRGL